MSLSWRRHGGRIDRAIVDDGVVIIYKTSDEEFLETGRRLEAFFVDDGLKTRYRGCAETAEECRELAETWYRQRAQEARRRAGKSKTA